MVRAVRTLVDAAKLLEVPVLATEQYPKGIGHLQPEVAEGFPPATEIIEKMSMSCCGQPRVRRGARRGSPGRRSSCAASKRTRA